MHVKIAQATASECCRESSWRHSCPLAAAPEGTRVIGHVTTMTGSEAYVLPPGAVPAVEDEVARVNAAGGINGWMLQVSSPTTVTGNTVHGIPP